MYRKRERTQNWSLEEKMYLLELVRARLDVLENKRIDSASSTMKGLAWQDIHAGFAARFGPDRDAHRVREQWRRMKGQARTEMVEFAERVRNFGPEMANQRRPSVLAEDVWKTLELARKLNMYPGSYQGQGGGGRGGADDTGSGGGEDFDDGDGDVCYPVEADVSFLSDYSPSGPTGDHDSRLENGLRVKREPEDTSADGDESQAREDFDGEHRVADGETGTGTSHGHGASDDDDRDDDDDEDDDMIENARSRTMPAQPNTRQKGDGAPNSGPSQSQGSSGDGPNSTPFVNMLRPKVELSYNPASDVPDIDSSMVPQGLSITAVRGVGNGFKRRAMQMDNSPSTAQLPPRPQPQMTVSSALAAEEKFARTSFLELRRQEQKRRTEILEAEHRAKMQLLRVERQTAEIRRRIALVEEARALGRDREAETVLSPGTPATPVTEQETPSPAPAATPAPATGAASPRGSDNAPSNVDAVVANGINGKTDASPSEEGDDQDEKDRAYSTNLGDLGSGAGKGGGSGGSIRDAGGAFGKREAGLEGEYFYKKQQEQLKQLKHDLTDEISFHEEQIKRHQEAIQRHKQRVTDLDKETK